MAALALVWGVLLGVFGLVGAGAMAALRIPPPGRVGDHLLAALWLGMLACASALLLFSALPLSPLTGPAVLVVLALLSALSAAARARALAFARLANGRTLGALAALLLGAAVVGSKQVTWYDTGLYHYQVIRWLADHGTVPGLALIHSRFGVISSWFALPAALEIGPLQGRTAAVLGGFVVLLAALRLVLAADRIATRRAGAADHFSLCAILIASPLLLWMGASSSPDLPVLVLAIVVGDLVLGARADDGRAGARFALPLALAAGALAIKVSSLPLALVTGLALLGSGGLRAWWLRLGIAGSAALVPLFLAGILASGCPLFPAALGCAALPWSIDPAHARAELTTIHEWARWEAYTPAGANDWNWIVPWLTRGPLNAAAAALLALSCCAAGWLWWRRRRSPLPQGGAAVLWIALAGSLFVLWSAPAPRFLWGYASLPIALAWAARATSRLPAGPARRAAPLRWSLAVALALAAAGIALGQLSSTIRGQWSASQLVLPPRMMAPPTVEHRVNDVLFRTPAGGDDRCWAAPLPCAPGALADPVRLRDAGRGIGGGFVRARTP